MKGSSKENKSKISSAVELVASNLKTIYEKYNISQYIECDKGCSSCCHQIVTISIFEAIRLAESIVKLGETEIIRIRRLAEKNVKVNNGIKIDSERWAHQLPCPLLNDGICSQYEVRPIVCQVANSNSREKCKQLYEDKNTRGLEVLEVMPPSHVGITNDSINMSLIEAVKNAGIVIPKTDRFYKHAVQIDIDKLLLYLCANTVEQRKNRVKRLINFDKKILNKLKKTSMNLNEYEHVYNVKID